MKLRVLFSWMACYGYLIASAQLSVPVGGTSAIITFDNTVSGVNNGSFTAPATYAATSPSAGQLNTGAFAASATTSTTFDWSSPTSITGGTGTSNGGTGTTGTFAFSNNGGTNRFWGIQPSGASYTPGALILRVQNNTGATATDFTVSYTGYYYNDEANGQAATGYYSTDGDAWTALATGFNFSSPQAAGASAWTTISGKTATVSGLTLLNAAYVYIKWVIEDVTGGSGSRDEIGIDNIQVSMTTTATTAPVTGLTVCMDNTTATLSWTQPSGTYDGIMVTAVNASAAPSGVSALNASTQTANAGFYSAPTYSGSTPASRVVYKGTAATCTITGLKKDTVYSFSVYAYQGTSLYSSATSVVNQLARIKGVTGLSGAATSTTSALLTWTNPTSCGFDEVLVIGRAGSAVTASPSSQTASNVWGSGYDYGSSQYAVYKGTSNTVSLTGLTGGTQYYFSVFVRKGTSWSVAATASVLTATVLKMGDIVLVAIDPNYSFGGSNSCDKIALMNLVEITEGTSILLTDCGYERGLAANVTSGVHNSCKEGVVRLTWNNATPLAAGTVFEIKPCESSYSGWTFAYESSAFSAFDLASAGDQLFVMQGKWSDSTLTGSYLYGVNTTLSGWTPTTSAVNNAASGDNSSRMPPELKCLNFDGYMNNDEARYKSTADYNDSRSTLLGFITDETNWTTGAVYSKPSNFTITGDGGTYGRWFGDNDADWFNSCNWDLYRVPDSTIDVLIQSGGGLGKPQDTEATLKTGKTAYCRNITLSGAGGAYPLKGVAGSNLYVYGNWSSSNAANFIESSSSVHFRGTSPQTINNTAAPETFYNMVVNNASGLTLAQDVQITNSLSLTNGVVQTGDKTLVVNNSASNGISGQSTASYIWGNLQRAVAANTAYDLPLGTSSRYQLATVTFGTGAVVGGGALRGSFSGTIGGNAPNVLNAAQDSVYSEMLDCGIWTIEPLTGTFSGTYNVMLYGRGGTNAASQGACVKRSDISADWATLGTATSVSNSGGVMSAGRNGLTGFSQFGIALKPVILGMLWTDAHIESHKNESLPFTRVHWQVEMEDVASGYFTVEMSLDDVSWETIGTQKASAAQQGAYMWDDFSSKAFNRFYRIRYDDANGATSYSATLQMNTEAVQSWSVGYPTRNVATGEQSVAVYMPQNGELSVCYYALTGARLQETRIHLPLGTTALPLAVAHLPAGAYICALSFEGEIQWRKLQVE